MTGVKRNLITFKEAITRLGFGSTTVYKLIASGKIDAFKKEGRTVVDAHSIDRYNDNLPKIEPKVSGDHA